MQQLSLQLPHLVGHLQASQHFLSAVQWQSVPHLQASQHLQTLFLQQLQSQQAQQAQLSPQQPLWSQQLPLMQKQSTHPATTPKRAPKNDPKKQQFINLLIPQVRLG